MMDNIKEKTNNKDDNDPSKWSKSKKKRMRAKFSKLAKRQGKPSGEKDIKNCLDIHVLII